MLWFSIGTYRMARSRPFSCPTNTNRCSTNDVAALRCPTVMCSGSRITLRALCSTTSGSVALKSARTSRLCVAACKMTSICHTKPPSNRRSASSSTNMRQVLKSTRCLFTKRSSNRGVADNTSTCADIVDVVVYDHE